MHYFFYQAEISKYLAVQKDKSEIVWGILMTRDKASLLDRYNIEQVISMDHGGKYVLNLISYSYLGSVE